MALIWDGNRSTVGGIEQRFAKDENGYPVTVVVSASVANDYGWGTIWKAAEKMAREGEMITSNGAHIIKVTVAHCDEIEEDCAGPIPRL